MSKKHYIEATLITGKKVWIEQMHEELITATKISIRDGKKRWLSDGERFVNLDHVIALKFVEVDINQDDSSLKELAEWL